MNKIVIESKIDACTELLHKMKHILAEHAKNKVLQEFLLYAAEKKAEEIVELAVSINQELLRDKGKLGLSYYDSFTNLRVFGAFTEDELKLLASTAGFRNRLAHEYLDVNADVALKSMKKMLQIYPPYLMNVTKIISTFSGKNLV